MYEVYCKETNNVIWRTNSVKEAEEVLEEQKEYHKNDNLTFGIR